MRIAVAGTGYVGLSLAVLLARRNEVAAVDVVPAKVEALSRWESAHPGHGDRGGARQGRLGGAPAARSRPRSTPRRRTRASTSPSWPPRRTTTRRGTSSTPRAWRRPCPPFARRARGRGSWSSPPCPSATRRSCASAWAIVASSSAPSSCARASALYDNLHPSRIIVGAPAMTTRRPSRQPRRFAALLAEGADPAASERENADGTVGSRRSCSAPPRPRR